ncbi:MIZ zinc finger protein [Moelleriella libera RCEF 2490]|uniref:MIZ zinc finger protein n=1 Tax=Moelleriella libera RCEF 2490 TaxID=1081109 RepID=A0A162IBH7_9HYPO|nr:MIZ zinc finger protein [Moelleriella libera RCEF 2490]
MTCWSQDLWHAWQRQAMFQLTETGGNEFEKWRYGRLADACASRDAFFLFLHQWYCTWSVDKSRLPSFLLEDRRFACFDVAFDFLTGIFDNNGIRSQHMDWLTRFPMQQSNLSLSMVPSQDLISCVCAFLTSFAQQWISGLTTVQRRRYPLFHWELSQFLACPPSILRLVLFMRSWRALGLPKGCYDRAANRLYYKDTINEARAIANPGRQEFNEMREWLIISYRKIVEQEFSSCTPGRYSSNTTVNAISAEPGTAQWRTIPVAAFPYGAESREDRVPAFAPNPASRSASFGFPNTLVLHSPGAHQLASASGSSVADDARQRGNASASPQQETQAPVTWYRADPSVHTTQQALPGGTPLRSGGTQAQSVAVQTPVSSYQADPSFHVIPHALLGNAPPQLGTQAQSAAAQAPLSSHQAHPPFHTIPRAPPRLTIPHNPPRPVPPQSDTQIQSVAPHASRSPSPPLKQAVRETHNRSATQPLSVSEHPHSPCDVTSVQLGLHLVRERSPVRICQTGPGNRFYQFLHGFALAPTPLISRVGISSFTFSVPEQQFLLKSRLLSPSCGQPRAHVFQQGSRRYRLKMTGPKVDDKEHDSATWASTKSAWPSEIYIQFNKEPVSVPRQQHFHHNLPIELTDKIVQGENVVEVVLPWTDEEEANPARTCHLAVEIVITMDHDSTVDMVRKSPHTSVERTQGEIRRQLQPSASAQEALHVSIQCPISANLIRTPVRGVLCKHVQCFDLETWLQTREKKKSLSQTEPCLADAWMCPLCDEDAAPPHLRIDAYISSILDTLLSSSPVQNVKSINAYAGGGWSAVIEPAGQGKNRDTDESRSKLAAMPGGEKQEPEVIVILDD